MDQDGATTLIESGVATWFVVVAFVTANLLGLWLVWNIWRSG